MVHVFFFLKQGKSTAVHNTGHINKNVIVITKQNNVAGHVAIKANA